MKYDLSVRERLVLLGCMPPRGDIVTLKIVRDLTEEMSFNEDEIKKLSLKTDPETNMIHWDDEAEKDVVKEVEIGEKAMAIIVGQLRDLNNKGELTAQHISVYDRFVE